MKSARFPHIDSLRAIAALGVLGTHAAVFAGADYPGSAVGRYAQRLEVGVAVFFVISGFLLYRPFAASRAAGEPPPRTGAYAWRRVLRIVPAYWLALTISTVVLGNWGVFHPGGLITYYGFGQAYREATIGGGLTQAWTLTIEVAFYAFLPLWAWLLRRLPGRSLRTEAVALTVLACVSIAWKVTVLSGMDPKQIRVTPLLIGLPSYLDQFALGMGLAVLTIWLRDHRPPAPIRLLDRFPGIAWAVAAVAFWAVSTQIGIGHRLFEPMTPGEYLARHFLYALIAVSLVAPAAVGTLERGLVRKLLAHPVLMWLGAVSYGVFLWHLTILTLLDRHGFRDALAIHPYLAWPLAALALTAIVAAVSWYGVERPALRLKRLLPRRRPEPAGPALIPAE
jgi:peptidoglycan/LPS O-acetylase OafA/YrhL